MTKSLLIIIAGPPGTGKTSLGKRVASEFHLPFIHKDGIKELLFDTLGWSDRAWSKRLGAASIALLYYFIDIQLCAGQSCIVESTFIAPLATSVFLDLKKKYDFEPLQIQCDCEGKVLFERFKQRAQSGERHPGHVEYLNYDEFKPILLEGKHEALNIGGSIYEIDTTDFELIDYTKLFVAIKAELLRVAQQLPHAASDRHWLGHSTE